LLQLNAAATSQSAAWGARYQTLTTETAQRYARILARYQELIDRVARGELSAPEVQAQLQRAVEDQASRATRDLVELSVELMSGLFYAEACYREALLDNLLPKAAPVPPPPAAAGLELTSWFQALAMYASQQSARAAGRQQTLIDRLASGELSASVVQEEGRRFVETEAPRFLDEVMNLGLSFVGRLQNSSVDLADALYDRVLGPEAVRETSPEPPITLELEGALGSELRAEIVVENAHPRETAVECRASEMAACTGGERFASGLVISPASFQLAPGAQRDVTLALPLDPARFAPSRDYVTSVHIAGAGERETVIELVVHTRPAPAAERSIRVTTSDKAPAAPMPEARRPRSPSGTRGGRRKA
jgi:hypothetical protein